MYKLSVDEMYEAFDRLWSDTTDFFKLEVLQHYAVSAEEESFQAFKEGRIKDVEDMQRKQLLDEAESDDDVKVTRVHIISFPISDYIKFELISYKISKYELNENIYCIEKSEADRVIGDLKLDMEVRDFLMFDDNVVIENIYDDSGNHLYSLMIEEQDVVSKYGLIKEALLSNSVDFEKFFSTFQE